MSFTWDPAKAASNLSKHGVSFDEAEEVFGDPLAIILDDPNHADRAVIIGRARSSELHYVVYVEVDEETLRIISARCATRRERKAYEEGT
jgi:hypothetical protein